MKPLRVCHVVPHLDRVGGYELAARSLARHQARAQGLFPILLTQAAPPRPAREARDGCEIHRLAHGLRRYHPGTWWRNRAGRIDLVHVHAMHRFSARVAALAARDGVPVVVKVATPTDLDVFAAPERLAELATRDETLPRAGSPGFRLRRASLRRSFTRLARADAFLALNAGVGARLAELGLPAVALANGVDTVRFAPPRPGPRRAARLAFGLREDDVVVAAVGRLVARKNLALLVAALAQALVTPDPPGGADTGPPRAGEAPRLRLLVAGDGPCRAELQALAARWGLADRVRLLGTLDDVCPLLQAADAFAHPATLEGHPNAVLEAAACGLPLLLSDIPGQREGFGPRTDGAATGALLLPTDDPGAWAGALHTLASDPARRAGLGRAARARVEADAALAVTSERLLALYRELLDRRARAGPHRAARPAAGG